MKIAGVVVLCLLLLCLIIGIFSPTKAPRTEGRRTTVIAAPEPAKPAHLGYDPTKKEERKKFIDNMQAKMIFGDVRLSHGVGYVVAGPKFYQATFDEKLTFVGVIFGWCLDSNPDCVAVSVTDKLTGKEVANYNAISNTFSVK